MIQSVKRCLRKVIGKTTLNFEELNTLLIEVESVINCRPLTFVYDQEGVSYALTPAHLIYGHRLNTSPSASCLEVVSTNKSLTRRARNQRHLLNQFVNCWRKDYLLSLQEFRAARLKGQGPSIKVGDIVILKNESSKRIFWNLAKVVELLKGSDEIARAALINVSTGRGPTKVLKRSIRHLIPIEVPDDNEESTTAENSLESDCVSELSAKPITRSRREAAVLGEKTRRTWTGH